MLALAPSSLRELPDSNTADATHSGRFGAHFQICFSDSSVRGNWVAKPAFIYGFTGSLKF